MAFVFPPAVRMVVIMAWGETDEAGTVRGTHALLPVVGIEAIPSLGDPGDLEDFFYHPIVILDGDVRALDHYLCSDYGGSVFVPAACPWPASEDEDRLLDEICSAETAGIRLELRHREKGEKPPSGRSATGQSPAKEVSDG
jgi:hypothetical protein